MAQKYSFEFHLGYANNLPSKLIIEQTGYEDIELKAHYHSEPFNSPYYWLWRISYKNDSTCNYEFEAVHHKIYLQNEHPDIQHFGISHGLNLLLLNRVKIFKHNFHLNTGVGLVLAHPENKIRNKPLKESGNGILGMGYYLSGGVINISGGKYFAISKRWYINTEIRFNPSYSVVPIVDGKAKVWNFAWQAIGGIGYFFIN